MKEHYVTYEQSVKLKELGFDGDGLKHYIRQGYYKFPNGYISPIKHDGDGILVQFRKEDAERIPAPRLDQAAAWLRDTRHYEVNAFWCYDCSKWESYAYDMTLPPLMGTDPLNKSFDTYELALSAVIDKVLELLTNKS